MADERDAITLEDPEPVEQFGEEADPPGDAGRAPSEEDLEPPEDTGGPDPGEEEAAAAGSATTWRVAKCLIRLRAEIDARWPNRDRRTDGTIGDTAHCGPGQSSDHCPNAAGVVRALDIDSDGIQAGWLAEHIRQLGKDGDARLRNGGYVIFNKRIASEVQGWVWRTYTGQSPHKDHIHFSVSRDAGGFDGSGGWGVKGATNIPASPPAAAHPVHRLGSRVLRLQNPNMRGTDVGFVQRWVGADDNGSYDQNTKARVERYQGIVGLEKTGEVGPLTWRAMNID